MIKHFSEINEHTKHVLDWTSLGLAVGTLIQILPAVAALWTIGWYTIRIYETKTVQDWLKSRKAKKNAK